MNFPESGTDAADLCRLVRRVQDSRNNCCFQNCGKIPIKKHETQGSNNVMKLQIFGGRNCKIEHILPHSFSTALSNMSLQMLIVFVENTAVSSTPSAVCTAVNLFRKQSAGRLPSTLSFPTVVFGFASANHSSRRICADCHFCYNNGENEISYQLTKHIEFVSTCF